MEHKNTPEGYARMLFARVQLIKDDSLEYKLDPKTAKVLSLQIAILTRDNYVDMIDRHP